MATQLTLKLDPNYASGLTTYEDFMVAAAKLISDIHRLTSEAMEYDERMTLWEQLSIKTHSDYAFMWELTCIPRHDLFCLVLRALVRATQRKPQAQYAC